MTIFLASGSPRRRELLKQIGVEFEVIEISIDEHWYEDEQPHLYVQRMALEKARAAKNMVPQNSGWIILAADTSVVLDNKVLGKAEDKLQAGEMLKLLSGRRHYVYSAVAIATINNEEIALSTSTVNFRLLSEPEITDYCDTGEPVGKAGAYAIQGRAAAFVERMEGSYSGVVGLPIYETARLLQKYARGC